MRRIMLLGAVVWLAGTAVALADPIEGSWKTQAGSSAQIGTCGAGYCITLTSGKFKGKRIGNMSSDGDGGYSGSITDPETDKTYSGSASINGGSLKMKGCVLGGLICRSQTWTRL